MAEDVHDFTESDTQDFTETKSRVKFKLDGDVFYGVRDLAVELALEFSAQSEKLNSDDVSTQDRIDTFKQVVRLLLEPESAELFLRRMRDPANPVGINKITEITNWLFEQYSLRPLEPGSDSSTGSDNPESGTNSTGNTSVEVLTSSVSV